MRSKIIIRKKVEVSQEVSLDEIAEELSRATDVQQYVFLNNFIHNLRINCKDVGRFEFQLSCISKGLNDASKDVFKFIGNNYED